MSFISYAQNFEDVMLWRALKHVENGFYVDIGAQDPLIDSVSLAFYEHAWRGVHVEPTQQYSSKLRMARPDETVFQVAIGNETGTLKFYEFQDTGLSTADNAIAVRHQDEGFRCNETIVPVISLDALFERIGMRDIHWLKLDVEGLEKSVLDSWKNSSVLPWVLVIESTRPMTQEENYCEWEGSILDKGYTYVYFDGLNRFYVSPAHVDLARSFSAPPNIFDGFILSGTASQPFYKLVDSLAQVAEIRAQTAETKAQAAEAKAQAAQAKAQAAEAKAQAAEAKAQAAETKAQAIEIKGRELQQAAHDWEVQANLWHERILALHSSTSWRVTKPLRAVKRLMGGNFVSLSGMTAAIKLWAKQTFRPVVSLGIAYVYNRPALRKLLAPCIKCFPSLYQGLVGVALNTNVVGCGARYLVRPSVTELPSHRPYMPLESDAMTLRARQIYRGLKVAMEKKGMGPD